MWSNQELFDKACWSLRTYGNPYGSQYDRGWGWCNPNNPNDRCALARLVDGNTATEVYSNIKNSIEDLEHNDIALEIIKLFDYYPLELNNSELLEKSLKYIAWLGDVKYTPPQAIETSQKEKELEYA